MGNGVAELRRLVHGARNIAVFTGAGASTDCGVPDFRTPGGIWDRYRPIDFKEFVASADTRLMAWRRYFEIHASFASAEPGRCHHAISALYRSGAVHGVITQNIDGLHARAGIPAQSIVELHGNGTYAACLSCRTRHEIEWVRAFMAERERAPECVSCGGAVKSATIAFGQSMPVAAMEEAKRLTREADLFLAIGSSLRVQPAAGFPLSAAQRGIPLVILNREPTPLDGIADLVVAGDAGEALSSLFEQ